MENNIKQPPDKIFNRNYCFILLVNFLFFFSFYLLIPILPFYLYDEFKVPNSQIGLIISCYTLAALFMRPFSGFLLDTFARKPLYLLSLIIFTFTFLGYIYATSISFIIFIRIIHGLSFGTVSVSGNTVVLDVLPSSRRGEGIGYYGIANNLAMSVGPMIGLFLHAHYSYNVIFYTSIGAGVLGIICLSQVKTKHRPTVARQALSLDRFLLLKGLYAGLALLLLSIPYGITSNYIAIYAKELNINISSGFFFSFMAIGLIISRIASGKKLDKGNITKVILKGMFIVFMSFLILGSLIYISFINSILTTIMYLLVAFILGLGFGTIFPAFNSLFVNLAPNNKFGTATSTYLTFWDMGIGIGIMLGGVISQYLSFSLAFIIGGFISLLSIITFAFIVTPHYYKNKLR